MDNRHEPQQWFADSKQVEISHGKLLLGVCLADTLLREVVKNESPPDGNPIIQELFHDFNKEPFFSSDAPTEEDEQECLEYIKTNVRWEDLEWHFQASNRESVGIARLMLNAETLTFKFVDERDPRRIYKYTKASRAKDFLVKNSIFLSAPTQFNDPFDCPFNGITRERMEKIGISCFSRKNDNSLMFSHYADEHRGMCLVFDPSHFVSLKNRWGVDVGGRVQRVCYYDKFPNFDEERQPAKIATSKHRDWSYEEEYRLFTNYAYPSGVYTFRSEALKGIIFGVRMTNDVKEEIYKLAVDAGCDINYYEAYKIPNSYNLDVIPIEFNTRKLKWSRKI